MRRLLLLRHAKTERLEPEMRDRDRRLTARGRSDAPLIGAYMARERLIPDLALVSTAARADETWRLVTTAFTKVPRAVPDARIYNASADTLAEIIGETQDAPALLVVGHNPGLHDLALLLIGSGNAEARKRISEELPTSGLAVIEFAFDDWSQLAGGLGRLECFVSPQLIAQASDPLFENFNQPHADDGIK